MAIGGGRGGTWKCIVSACLIASASAVSTCGNAVWTAPPRFDGAGYAVLARACLTGQGYRAIDHPDRPRHAHFPPGYPMLLAFAWWITGESAIVAHGVSACCTVGACLAAWLWFRRMMSEPSATLLALALSVNWLWARIGAAILSEPLYLLLSQCALLAASRIGARRSAIVPGALLAACLLTRQVAVGLALAVLADLIARRRWRAVAIVVTVVLLLVAPWIVWMMSVGPEGRTQAGLLVRPDGAGFHRIVDQLVFYLQRIPDQIIGPFVEVGAAFHPRPFTSLAANGWAVAATSVIAVGWSRALRRPRRRLAAMVPIGTLLVLLPWPFTEAGRFLVPLVPCILIGAVEGLVGLMTWSRRLGAIGGFRCPARRSRLRVVATALVLTASLPYSGYLLVKGRARAIEASQADFDAACAWLAAHDDRPGPVLARHPGDVYWQTGREALEVPTAERPGDADASAEAIARTIASYRAAYLLIDQDRYAQAPISPLARYVADHPERARKVWGREAGQSTVAIYEVEPAR